MTIDFIPPEAAADDHVYRRTLIVLAILFGIGLALLGLGLGLPRALGSEPATPMPYTVPVGHPVYLHTAGDPARCTVDDGVTEPFTLSVPAARLFQLGGYRLSAPTTRPATITCRDRVTVDLDPDVGYAVAGSKAILSAIDVAGVLAMMIAVRVAIARSVRRAAVKERARWGGSVRRG